MKDIINNLKKSDTQKTQLTIRISFISSKNTEEQCLMHSKNDNIEIMIYDKVYEVIENLLELLLKRYQIGLEASLRGIII